jgi:hypothetical protein
MGKSFQNGWVASDVPVQFLQIDAVLIAKLFDAAGNVQPMTF